MNEIDESIAELLVSLQLAEDYNSLPLELMSKGESNYVKDLKVNLKNVLTSNYLSLKETSLLGLSIAVNAKNKALISYFTLLSEAQGATYQELGEATACASLLASNNVFYRFRHFVDKEKYNQLPGRIRMNIMMKPATGKEFFELMSLAVSAVNGCEMCVKAHEHSLIELGTKEERIFDTIRLAAVVTSLDRVVYA